MEATKKKNIRELFAEKGGWKYKEFAKNAYESIPMNKLIEELGFTARWDGRSNLYKDLHVFGTRDNILLVDYVNTWQNLNTQNSGRGIVSFISSMLKNTSVKRAPEQYTKNDEWKYWQEEAIIFLLKHKPLKELGIEWDTSDEGMSAMLESAKATKAAARVEGRQKRMDSVQIIRLPEKNYMVYNFLRDKRKIPEWIINYSMNHLQNVYAATPGGTSHSPETAQAIAEGNYPVGACFVSFGKNPNTHTQSVAMTEDYNIGWWLVSEKNYTTPTKGSLRGSINSIPSFTLPSQAQLGKHDPNNIVTILEGQIDVMAYYAAYPERTVTSVAGLNTKVAAKTTKQVLDNGGVVIMDFDGDGQGVMAINHYARDLYALLGEQSLEQQNKNLSGLSPQEKEDIITAEGKFKFDEAFKKGKIDFMNIPWLNLKECLKKGEAFYLPTQGNDDRRAAATMFWQKIRKEIGFDELRARGQEVNEYDEQTILNAMKLGGQVLEQYKAKGLINLCNLHPTFSHYTPDEDIKFKAKEVAKSITEFPFNYIAIPEVKFEEKQDGLLDEQRERLFAELTHKNNLFINEVKNALGEAQFREYLALGRIIEEKHMPKVEKDYNDALRAHSWPEFSERVAKNTKQFANAYPAPNYAAPKQTAVSSGMSMRNN